MTATMLLSATGSALMWLRRSWAEPSASGMPASCFCARAATSLVSVRRATVSISRTGSADCEIKPWLISRSLWGGTGVTSMSASDL